MTAHPTDRLSDYLDGDLATEARTAIEAHLQVCAGCRLAVEDLRALAVSAAAWAEAPAIPARDFWPGIAARLSSPRATAVGAPSSAVHGGLASVTAAVPVPWYRRRWSVGVPELALAASLMAAVTGAALYQRGGRPAVPVAEPSPIVAEVESFGPAEAGVVPVSFADAQYDAAVRDLERVLLDQRDRLDPRTVIVLERNLRVIDEAIREAREALGADPANTLLNSHLASARRRKLDLLRRAALITEAN
jgi:Putative zinc-finger